MKTLVNNIKAIDVKTVIFFAGIVVITIITIAALANYPTLGRC